MNNPEEATADTIPPEEVMLEEVVEEPAQVASYEPISTPSDATPPKLGEGRVLRPGEVGGYIVQLCKLNVPSDYGDAKFKVICRDFVKGYGTCCGFVPHWALFEAGCRMKFISRTEPEAGITYRVGRNINLLWNNGNPPFKRFVRGTTPPPGATVYVSNGPPNTEHVFIFEEAVTDDQGKVWWKGFHGGQTNPKTGEQCIRAKQLPLDGRLVGGRGIIGWLDPADLEFTAPAAELCNPDGDICYEPEDFLTTVND